MRPPTEEEKEIAAIIEAQEDFHFFTRYMFKKRRRFMWRDNWHHKVLCDTLMEVYRGNCPRLIINMPPRYSKTEIAVVNFIAWCFGHHPDAEFIHTSYSDRLATKNSWNARALVEHNEYRKIFPHLRLREDSRAKDEWRTTEDGCMYAVGLGGTTTGYGAGKDREEFGGAIIIDDPHKAKEARSPIKRQAVIDWYDDTLSSRINSATTPIILIMQRLVEGDLADWLQQGGSGEEWRTLCFKAIQDDGTALWPHKHSIEKLREMEQARPYVFASQYQQSPTPMEGGFFKPDMMPIIPAAQAGGRAVRKWDLAGTADGGDFTAGPKLIEYPDKRYTIADMIRFQGGPDEVERTVINTAHADGKDVAIHLSQDPGQAGKAQVKNLTAKLSGFAVHSDKETGDKVTRAQPFAAQVNVGNVSMVKGPWNDALKNELRLFPNGKYDDQIDACAGGFNFLANAPRFHFAV